MAVDWQVILPFWPSMLASWTGSEHSFRGDSRSVSWQCLCLHDKLCVTCSEMIHLMVLPNPDTLDLAKRPQHGGRDRHVCIGERLPSPSASLQMFIACMPASKRARLPISCHDGVSMIWQASCHDGLCMLQHGMRASLSCRRRAVHQSTCGAPGEGRRAIYQVDERPAGNLLP